MKEILLTQGQVALVDDEDYDYLRQWNWFVQKYKNKFSYAVRGTEINYIQKIIMMHHEVIKRMGLIILEGYVGDHIDRNKINNQRYNLRVVTKSMDSLNKGLQQNNTSGYPGVWFAKERNQWIARIQINRKIIHLGYYDFKKNAIEARQEAELQYFGEILN